MNRTHGICFPRWEFMKTILCIIGCAHEHISTMNKQQCNGCSLCLTVVAYAPRTDPFCRHYIQISPIKDMGLLCSVHQAPTILHFYLITTFFAIGSLVLLLELIITVTSNGRDGVSNHQPHGCLLNRVFMRRSKKTSKLRVTGLCAGNSPVTCTNGQ